MFKGMNDGAGRLVHMGAVVEFALADPWCKFGHGVLNLRERKLRHAELFKAGRVDDLRGVTIQFAVK